jgi:hypothetical protein
MAKKIISFSLWGDEDLYNLGALQNIPVAQEHYPGWICRFYVHEKIPVLGNLRSESVEVVVMPDPVNPWEPLFWRFAPVSEPDVEYAIFRDCDSRLNGKEAAAVNAWIASGKNMHVMKDHDSHRGSLIMGGMWGIRGGVIPDINKMMCEWFIKQPVNSKGDDQLFLEKVLWPLVKDSVLIHGKSSRAGPGTPFPPHTPLKSEKSGEYIGQVVWPWKD